MQPGAADLPLRLETFLLGRTTAEGSFRDPFGVVRRRMAIVLDGWMDGAVFALDENFTFDDGATERRMWRITPVGADGYIAEADDMIGAATGRVTARGVGWSYLFNLQIGARRYRVRFKETFVLLDAHTMLNRARITKFGMPLGQTHIVFRRPPA